MKHIDEIKNYFIEEINKYELMRKKHRMFCATLNYIEHLLILASAVTGCVSISAFASSVVIPLGIRCSSVGLKFVAITVVIKKCKSIIKKQKKKHGKIVLLSVRIKLNTIEVLISGALMYSYISHKKFFLANNVLKENHDVKEDTKNLKTSIVQQRF